MSNVKTQGLNNIGLLINQCIGHLMFVAAKYQSLPTLGVYGPISPKMCEQVVLWVDSQSAGQPAQSDSDAMSRSPPGL